MAVLHAALWVLAGCVCLSRADGGLYSLSAVDINGNDVQMEDYRGKVMHNWIAFSFSIDNIAILSMVSAGFFLHSLFVV